MLLTLLAVGVLQAQPTVTIGGSAAMVGIQGSAQHTLGPGALAWASWAGSTYGATLEGLISGRHRSFGAYDYRTFHVGTALTLDWRSKGDIYVLAGLGPAASLQVTRYADSQRTVHMQRLRPGMRGRAGMAGPIGDHLSWRFHVGATAQPGGLDHDTALGLGRRW